MLQRSVELMHDCTRMHKNALMHKNELQVKRKHTNGYDLSCKTYTLASKDNPSAFPSTVKTHATHILKEKKNPNVKNNFFWEIEQIKLYY